MTDSPFPVVPSLAIAPSFRARMIETYRQLAQAESEHELSRPSIEQHCRNQIHRLEYGGDLDLSVLLESEP